MGHWVWARGMGIPEFTKDATDRLIKKLGENEWYQCQCAGAIHTCVGMAGWSNDRPPATGTWEADDDWDGPMELN